MVSVSAKNNPRNYGIARNCGSGLRHWRTLLSPLLRIFLASVAGAWKYIVGARKKNGWKRGRHARGEGASTRKAHNFMSAFSRSHVSYKSDKFWTVSDGRKLRIIQTIQLIAWFKIFKEGWSVGVNVIVSCNRSLPVIIQNSSRIEWSNRVRRKIIRQRKESMRPLASYFSFFAVIALYRTFFLFKKVGRIVEFKTFKIRRKYNSCILGDNL